MSEQNLTPEQEKELFEQYRERGYSKLNKEEKAIYKELKKKYLMEEMKPEVSTPEEKESTVVDTEAEYVLKDNILHNDEMFKKGTVLEGTHEVIPHFLRQGYITKK